MAEPAHEDKQKPSNLPRSTGVDSREQVGGGPLAAPRTSAEGERTPLQADVLEEVSDEELFRRGDRESLAVLVRRHQTTLFNLLVHVTGGDSSLADDLFQETFVRAVRGAKTFDSTKSFRAWLTAIALNLVRDEVRKRKSRSEVALNEEQTEERANPVAPDLPLVSMEQMDEAQRVRGALVQLTDKEREVVLLHFYEGLTLVEAADVLNVPIGTAKSRLHGALVRLKALLRQ
jgi:RNA polymerase sigma-70 factor (ECF subfamily)